MARIRSFVVAGLILMSAIAALGTARDAAAATGSPGDVRYTTVSAFGGLGGVLTLDSGFSLYRSPAAPKYVQDLTLQLNVWKWNGSGWSFYRSMRQTIRTNPGQYANFPALSVPVYSSGQYTVTTDETWAYTNGAVIGTDALLYNAFSDYWCGGPRDGTCAEMNGWVELIVFSV